MKEFLAAISVLGLVWGLAGCETTRGAAEDISNTGENIGQGLGVEREEETPAVEGASDNQTYSGSENLDATTGRGTGGGY